MAVTPPTAGSPPPPGPFTASGAPPPPGVLQARGRSAVAKVDASPLSQALAFGAFALMFAALSIRFDDLVIVVLASAALATGIAAGLGVDLRRVSRAIPGVVLAVVTVIVLSFVWALLESRGGSGVPYPAVLLIGLVVLGCDWYFVDRLRPAVVISGLGLVPLLEADLSAALVVSLAWFATAATALWSFQRDVRRSLPTPVPLGPARPVDPSGRELVTIAGAAVAVAVVFTFLIAMIDIDSSNPAVSESRSGRTLPGGSGEPSSGRNGPSQSGPGQPDGGSGSGSGSGSGPTFPAGPTSGSGSGSEGALGTLTDRNGDGVIDHDDGLAALDTNGDGIIDERDAVVPVDRNGDGVVDHNDGIIWLDLDGDGTIDERDAGGAVDRNGDGVIDRDDVPILSDTNGDGIVDRRDVVIVEDLTGDGRIDDEDVFVAADRNGDGAVDGRDDLEIIDANGDGAVDDGELLDTLDRNGDGVIDRGEALVLDRSGNGRLERSEIDELPLSGDLGAELDARRRAIEDDARLDTALLAFAAIILIGLTAAGVIALRRHRAHQRELDARPWALVLVERLEDEGSLRGRRRSTNEPIAHFAASLGDCELADPRLAEVGSLISAALFAPEPPSESSGAWAAEVIAEAAAAHPVPTRGEARRERRERGRSDRRDRSGDAEADPIASPL